ncbi:ATP-dependent protease Lon [Candidatus Gastranaerophilus sp. (ex Termes propinquus)]|nr:ATP-dependent protease Lon [Candidatus Gastranaerophilus sp. (ex Termes propinquus)]
MTITKEQLLNLIKIADLDVNPDFVSSDDISKALIAIEKKLNFFNYPLSFFTAEVLNVLIVDDMELSIYQLTTMLKKIGMNICVARNKQEALAEMKKKTFDYVIIDLFLPDAEDGFELIKESQNIKNRDNKDFKLVVISGTDDKKMVQECYKLGVDEFISKQPDWHERVLRFISNATSKLSNEEFHKYYINDNICMFAIYKINHQRYVDKILNEVNKNVLTGRSNVVFNMEHIKIFSDNYASIFAEVYKATSSKGGMFIIIKPSDDVKKALNYVFLNNVISIFDTVESAIEHIELNTFAD